MFFYVPYLSNMPFICQLEHVVAFSLTTEAIERKEEKKEQQMREE